MQTKQPLSDLKHCYFLKATVLSAKQQLSYMSNTSGVNTSKPEKAMGFIRCGHMAFSGHSAFH